jgi:hypothetical protein
VEVAGNLGEVLESVVSDADDMYFNKGGAISGKYGYPAREVLFNWWTALRLMDKELKHQKQFKGAKTVALVQNKAVEPAYNYYGIEAQRITDRLGIVIFSLVFYVAYTLWYGFAILFLFEGWGMRLGH